MSQCLKSLYKNARKVSHGEYVFSEYVKIAISFWMLTICIILKLNCTGSFFCLVYIYI